jgi:hypothetical protein
VLLAFDGQNNADNKSAVICLKYIINGNFTPGFLGVKRKKKLWGSERERVTMRLNALL